MKNFLFTFLVLIFSISVASAQNPLIMVYEGNGIMGQAGILPSEATKAKENIVSKLEQNFQVILIEYKQNFSGKYQPKTVWIYLSNESIKNYTDVTNASSDYIGTIDLFCINLSSKLRRILDFRGIKGFLEAIGVEYHINENGDILSTIDYAKFKKFV